MILGILGANLLGNILAEKEAIAKDQGRVVNRPEELAMEKSTSEQIKTKKQYQGIVRGGYGNKNVQKTITKNENNV